MDFPPGTGVEPILDEDKQLIGVKLTPFFIGRRTSATAVRATSKSAQGEALDEFHLVVSAVTGTARKQSRTESAKPWCDMTDAERAKVKKAKDEDDEVDEVDEDEDEEEDEDK